VRRSSNRLPESCFSERNLRLNDEIFTNWKSNRKYHSVVFVYHSSRVLRIYILIEQNEIEKILFHNDIHVILKIYTEQI